MEVLFRSAERKRLFKCICYLCRERNEELKKEIQDQEASYKIQLAAAEEKARDLWVRSKNQLLSVVVFTKQPTAMNSELF